MRSALVVVALFLCHSLARADDAVPAAAEVERSAAVTASEAEAWDKALASADKTIKLAPSWPEAYRTRAGIRIAAAGPEGTIEHLKAPVAGVDYKRIAKLLQGASDDLKRYTELAPQAADVKTALRLSGEVRMRGELAAGAGKRKLSPPQCYEGQTKQGNRCRGIASCPRGMGYDAPTESCVCMPGAAPASNDAHYCCWPNQVMAVKKGVNQCTGTPACPAGYTRIDALETCVPMMILEKDIVARGGCSAPSAFAVVPDDIAIALGIPTRAASAFDLRDQWKGFFERYLLPPGLTYVERRAGSTYDSATTAWKAILQPTLTAKQCSGDPFSACCKNL